MQNSAYLYSIGVTNATVHERCSAAMDKYGENHWEEGQPVQKLAYFQLHEPIMLVQDFSRFHAAVGTLLGQPVVNMEFGTLGSISLRERAEAAYAKFLEEVQA